MKTLTPHQRAIVYKIIGITRERPMLTPVQIASELDKDGVVITPEEIVKLCAEAGYSAIETDAYLKNEIAILEFMASQLSIQITKSLDAGGTYEDGHLYTKLKNINSILAQKKGLGKKKDPKISEKEEDLVSTFVSERNSLHKERYNAGMERKEKGADVSPPPDDEENEN